MTLSTTHVVGDTGHTSDHNAIATAVNTNTNNIAANTSALNATMQKANNLSDVANVASALANLGLTGAIVGLSTGVTTRIWVQATDPDTTNPGVAADGDLWFFPAA